MLDAVVVGAGPNGLAAAVTLARAGLSVEVLEAGDAVGGAAATRELTEPGFLHDVGSAVHPLAVASPFFRRFGLTDRTPFTTPEASYAHPLDGERAAIAWRDVRRTADELGDPSWRRLLGPLAGRSSALAETLLTPLVPYPRHPFVAAGFAGSVAAVRAGLAPLGAEGRALLAGVLAHAVVPQPSLAAAGAGLVLAAFAHSGGWPVPRGGSQSIVDTLVADLVAHGGVITTGARVRSLADLPSARVHFFDTSAPDLLRIGGDALDDRYARALSRVRAGGAASKVDFALSAPVPWRDPRIGHATTVHVGGSADEIAAGEADVASGRHPASPYVLVAQPSLVDETRAPAGKQTLWTYTHVPNGSTRDMTEPIVAQIERFAPGFRDTIIASVATTATGIGRWNPSMPGGDIASGGISIAGVLARPRLSTRPWAAAPGMYLCGAAAAPGPGVHGMGGYSAAVLALREVFGIAEPSLAP
ncbi:NAD(P)/FAD-dependent oxidoreductase [Agromyces atrinae]|uniref:phytoene desaturase family protein n=1 Tax=Agromyces atrinae TaxID=592376 RepID=UPI001F5757CE|nr:NAD(P)/FAD-dependent oxidoreductase [Agromyces atrinae]MCI2957733.1 NAD(P)/FAD-dependent oxidoreductase [Agromyces atrinae]